MEVMLLVVAMGMLLYCFKTTTQLQENLVKKFSALSEEVKKTNAPVISIDLSDIEKRIDQLPLKVNQSITASASHHKGNLGELIAYIQLNSIYDRLIPVGDVFDLLGIRFPKDDDPGTVDFIDVKNGPSAGLNKNQKSFKKLIETTKPQFVVTSLDTTIQ